MGNITVVGLGRDAGSLTLAGAQALRGATRRILRTQRHAAAQWLQEEKLPFESLDALYETCEDFDALNCAAAQHVIDASETCDVVYAVPGAADMTDETLCELARRGAIDHVIGGVSDDSVLLSRVLCEQKQAAFDGRCQRLSAQQISDFDVDVTIPLVVVELKDVLTAGEVKIRLLEYYPDLHTCYVLLRDKLQSIALYELDRVKGVDDAAALFVPQIGGLTDLERFGFRQLCDMMTRLRAPGGCPWDAQQTHHSIEEYLIEEAYEALDAIRREDDEACVEELGDLLLQIVFHASLGEQYGEYDMRDIISAVCAKMIHRHPHVFPREDGARGWEQIKNEEKGFVSVADTLCDVPRAMPAAMRVQKLQKRSGLYCDVEQVQEKLSGSFARLQTEKTPEAFAAAAFDLCALARLFDVSVEMELSRACDGFCDFYRDMEKKGTEVCEKPLRKAIFTQND